MISSLAQWYHTHLPPVRGVKHRRGVFHAEGAERYRLGPGVHIHIKGVPVEEILLFADDLDLGEHRLHHAAQFVPVLALHAETGSEPVAAPGVEQRSQLFQHADRITACRHAQRTAHNVAHRCHKGHRRITLTADAARDAA